MINGLSRLGSGECFLLFFSEVQVDPRTHFASIHWALFIPPPSSKWRGLVWSAKDKKCPNCIGLAGPKCPQCFECWEKTYGCVHLILDDDEDLQPVKDQVLALCQRRFNLSSLSWVAFLDQSGLHFWIVWLVQRATGRDRGWIEEVDSFGLTARQVAREVVSRCQPEFSSVTTCEQMDAIVRKEA